MADIIELIGPYGAEPSFGEVVVRVRFLKQEKADLVRALEQIESAAGYMPDLKPTPEELARKIAGLRSAFGQMLQQSGPKTYGVSDFQSMAQAVGSLPEADRGRVMRAVAVYFGIKGDMG